MEEDVETKDRVRTIVIALVLTALGLGGGVVLTVGGLVFLQSLGVETTVPVVLVTSLVLTQGVAFGGIAILYLRYRGLPLDYVSARLPSLREVLWVGAGYVLALLGVWASAFVATLLFGQVEARNQAVELAIESPEVLLLMIPASFVLIGPGEELLFRGVIQGTLREVFPAVPAIVLASAIFAGIHFLALSGAATARLVAVAVLFVPALVFGVAYEKTDNIVVPSLIHGAYNATLFALLYVAIKYGSRLQESASVVY